MKDKIYSQIFIYKIYCKDPTITHFYIGSTCNLYQRTALHKSKLKQGCNYKLYDFMRNNGGWDNWDIAVIETRNNQTHTEKLNLEKYYFNTFNPLLNSHKCGRTHKEYLKDNYDKILLQRYNNRLKHLEKRKITAKERYSNNKKICIERSQNYYKKNKDKINQKKQTKYNCLCGETITIGTRKKHLKTKNHSDNLKNIFCCIKIIDE
tara:strand:- start:23 stop:643 length:621 start_codon:yes stop_codon:yes gene_type:complete